MADSDYQTRATAAGWALLAPDQLAEHGFAGAPGSVFIQPLPVGEHCFESPATGDAAWQALCAEMGL